MTITISHRGMELTQALREYAEEKMNTLTKYVDDIEHVDVELGIEHHHQRKGDIFLCKAVVQVVGEIICVQREEEDLYKAVDKVRDHLRVELSDWKKRQESKRIRAREEQVV